MYSYRPTYLSFIRHIPRIYAGRQRRECDCQNCGKTNNTDSNNYRKQETREKEEDFSLTRRSEEYIQVQEEEPVLLEKKPKKVKPSKKKYKPNKKETNERLECDGYVEDQRDQKDQANKRVQLVEEEPQSKPNKETRSKGCSCCRSSKKRNAPKDVYMPRKSKGNKINSEESEADMREDTEKPKSVKSKKSVSRRSSNGDKYRRRTFENNGLTSEESRESAIEQPEKQAKRPKESRSKAIYVMRGERRDVEPQTETETTPRRTSSDRTVKAKTKPSKQKKKEVQKREVSENKEEKARAESTTKVSEERMRSIENELVILKDQVSCLVQEKQQCAKEPNKEKVQKDKQIYEKVVVVESAIKVCTNERKTDKVKKEKKQSRKTLANTEQKGTDDPSVCPYCKNKEIPTVSQGLCLRIRNLAIMYRPRDVVLNIVLQPNGLYHINMATRKDGKSMTCLLASEDAVREAREQGLFKRVLTFYVADGRSGGNGDAAILDKTFEVV